MLVLSFASLVRSSFGFGEALFAVPLLALMMPVKEAAPLAVLASITVAAIVLVQDWSDVNVRSASHLVLSSIVGIPLGLLFLTKIPEPIVKAGLGGLILGFSIFSLTSTRPYELKNDGKAWIFGFSAGVLGGAYGMNGPPLVIYGALRGWSPREFRATLQGYFFPASLIIMFGFWISGLWTRAITRYYLVCLPALIIAVLVGRVINRRMHPSRFLRYVYVALTLIGLVLMAQAVR